MSRIDVQTLVLAFERRIGELEKNPPDQVPMNVVLNLLDKAIDEVIRQHFIDIAYEDIQNLVKKELSNYHGEFIKKSVVNILTNEIFRDSLEAKFKKAMLDGIMNLTFKPYDD